MNNEGEGKRTCHIDIIIIIMSSSKLYFRIKVVFTKKTDKMKDLTDCDRLCNVYFVRPSSYNSGRKISRVFEILLILPRWSNTLLSGGDEK